MNKRSGMIDGSSSRKRNRRRSQRAANGRAGGRRIATRACALGVSLAASLSASAAVVYDQWKTTYGEVGNYILTVSETAANEFSFDLTVDPWNAEVLILAVDLGDVDLNTGELEIGDSTPDGEVSLLYTDVPSLDCVFCGRLNPDLEKPVGEWELVFQLGDWGFDKIQTFQWTLEGLRSKDEERITENDLGTMGVVAQNLCPSGELLPDGNCRWGVDLSYSSSPATVPPSVPIPAAAWLFVSGLAALGWFARRT